MATQGQTPVEEAEAVRSNFIREIIDSDLEKGTYGDKVATRFPPEPNGYLHIGHAKSICLNFGIARDYSGTCNLRFDDTNPSKESIEYVEAIKKDVQWMGFSWGERQFFASDYFEQLYQYAIQLIKMGKAYVCSLGPDEIREYRGTLTEPGKESPFRNRSVEENLDLFTRMRAGEFPDGEHVLRAKIDMAAANVIMRDPTLYRIKHVAHHRTGDAWPIYPMYDFTHCLSDAIEEITHSLCTLEFENNRELYDWVLDTLGLSPRPYQYEFARLNLTYTVLSKRRLIQLVEEGLVNGWDDPRMPTLSGLRRRGYTPEAIRTFCDKIGIAKSDNMVDYAMLDFCLREDLNDRAPRVMGVVKPLKMVITNYPEGGEEEFEFPYHPEDEAMGSRKVPFSRELYIEQDDFREDPPRKYFRLSPGREVRLRYAYYVTCEDVIKDPATGEVIEVHCTYDPKTKGGWSEDGRKVKGTLHWVSAKHAVQAEVRLYDKLFTQENPMDVPEGQDFKDVINAESLEVVPGYVEPSLASVEPGYHCQFERLGYYCADPDSTPGKPVFNRITTLRDTWARKERSQQGKKA
ncbi:MAG: glutamine--tRNA ligase/YqeY domain fusion protein [Desulfovibrio sp.]|nr:MAG: glutamine--tRNA ligase/YqeY domain fusion protein [Desulfovibrio sp.]